MSTVRPARPDDAPACVAILSDWIEETPWMPRLHSHDSMVGFWRQRLTDARGWVAERDGTVAGFALRDGADLTALYLRREARGLGLGRRLLGAAQTGQDRLHLWVFAANRPARAFYTKAGFTETGRTAGDNEEGLPDIAMEWRAQAQPKSQAPKDQ